jgi:hypothetical protein
VSLVSAPLAVGRLRARSSFDVGVPIRTLASLLQSWYRLRADQWLTASELAELRAD